MWYSTLGALSTIILGLLISVIINAVQENRVMNITQKPRPRGRISTISNKNTKSITPSFPLSPSIVISSQKLAFENPTMRVDDE